MTITDLGAARWAKAQSPRDVSIADMLRESLRLIEGGEINPRHAIVLFDVDDDGGSQCQYLSAGSHSAFESMGMLHHAADLMSRG